MPKLCDNRDTGGALLGPRGALAPLVNENSHYVNSKMATVHYCSKRATPPHLSEIQGQAPPLALGKRSWDRIPWCAKKILTSDTFCSGSATRPGSIVPVPKPGQKPIWNRDKRLNL